jgi:uncharacterized lipoprotein YddW (UPF0748 family)
MRRNIAQIIVFLLFVTSFSLYAQQKRGMWVVRYALNNDNISEIILTSHSLAITDLYVQVWALNKKYYNKNTNFKNLVRAAHKNGIKVHAWMNVLYVWSGKSKIGIEKRSLKSLLRNGKTIPSYSELKKKGIEGFYIHPYDEDNLKNIYCMCDELIDSFNVDGIHLDYFRYPDLKYSLSPSGRARFMLQNYYDPKVLFDQNGEIKRNNYFVYNEYSAFLKSELTSILRSIKERTYRDDKKIELSIAVKPDADIAESKYFQSWKEWIEKKYCDYVILMNYNADNSIFEGNLKKALSIGLNDRIMIGVATYNQDWHQFLNKYKMVMNTNVRGAVIFSYNYLSENKNYYRSIAVHGN